MDRSGRAFGCRFCFVLREPWRDCIELSYLRAAHPGIGDGTRFMRALVEQLDAYKYACVLLPHPMETANHPKISVEALLAFYSRFGFTLDTSGWMRREPNSNTL